MNEVYRKERVSSLRAPVKWHKVDLLFAMWNFSVNKQTNKQVAVVTKQNLIRAI